MERKGAVVIATVAAAVNLVIIAAAGNQWYYDHVAVKSSSNGANATIKQVPIAFRWRLSNWSGDNNLRLGEVVASGLVIVLVFFLVWIVIYSQRRPRGFFGPFFAIWGLEMLSAVLAAMAGTFVSYPGLFGSRANPLGTTRFWWSVIEGPAAQVVMWALCVGFIAALLCALITIGQKAEPVDDFSRPEDAFFPPRTPDLTAPPAAMASAGVGNPELAAYGWAPEEAAARTQALPTTGGAAEPARAEPPAEVPVAEDTPTEHHRLYAPPPEPEPEPAPQPAPEPAAESTSDGASAGAASEGGAADETREIPTTESADSAPPSDQAGEPPRRPWPES